MPDLNFSIESVEPIPYAVGPMLSFKLRVTQAAHPTAPALSSPLAPGTGERAGVRGPLEDASLSTNKENPSSDDSVSAIHSVALRCQIRLEPGRRRYNTAEQHRLFDLFGEPARWGQTMRAMLWTHASVVLPAFQNETQVDLPVACTYDFNVAAAKYFYALEDGQVPLCFLFSGTIFYAGDDGALQVTQISWEKEASFKLPVPVWKRMMDLYYPNTAWLCLRQDVFDRLSNYKSRSGRPTWEAAIEKLLADAGAPDPQEKTAILS